MKGSSNLPLLSNAFTLSGVNPTNNTTESMKVFREVLAKQSTSELFTRNTTEATSKINKLFIVVAIL